MKQNLNVDTPLIVRIDNTWQESLAVNFSSDKTVLINRFQWISEGDLRIKSALVLHEVLGLVGLETTGFYPISSRYLEKSGLTGKDLLLKKDDSHTFVSCLDGEQGVAHISVGPQKRDANSGLGGAYYNRVGIEVIDFLNPQQIQQIAQALGVTQSHKVYSLSLGMPSKVASNGNHPFDLCFFDLIDRAYVSCSNTPLTNNVTTGVSFKTTDGELIKSSTNTAQFSISKMLKDETGAFVRKIKLNLEPGGKIEFSVRANACSR